MCFVLTDKRSLAYVLIEYYIYALTRILVHVYVRVLKFVFLFDTRIKIIKLRN